MQLTTAIKAMALAGTSAILYARFGRPWVVNWGATGAEAASTLPGDDILPNANLQTTRAITIQAPPQRVWPWLVQIGPRPRAGIYTYDWIERLLGIDIENSDRILPEFQHLEPGEFFDLDHKGNGLYVREVQPERALVLQWKTEKSTWAFVLNREGEHATRLISRNRIMGGGPAFVFGMAIMEPGSLIMERKMLLGIKERAERTAAAAIPANAMSAANNGN